MDYFLFFSEHLIKWMNKNEYPIGNGTFVIVLCDNVFTSVNCSCRILHFSRFCGKQKNNQQSESWLDGTISSIEKYRQDYTPVQADLHHQQARHDGFVV